MRGGALVACAGEEGVRDLRAAELAEGGARVAPGLGVRVVEAGEEERAELRGVRGEAAEGADEAGAERGASVPSRSRAPGAAGPPARTIAVGEPATPSDYPRPC